MLYISYFSHYVCITSIVSLLAIQEHEELQAQLQTEKDLKDAVFKQAQMVWQVNQKAINCSAHPDHC